MQIKNIKVDLLVPYDKNTKKHDDAQINNVAESIKQYGFVQPIVIDKNNVVVIGHCRLLAAKKLKMADVPCVCVEDLTDEQVKALRIVDNKSNESPWDFDFLADELAEISLDGFDFDFGIDTDAGDDAEIVEDEAPEVDEENEPNLMGFEGNVHADGSKSFNAKHGAIKNDKMSREDGDKFILSIFENIKEFNKGAYYVCFYRLGLDYIFRALDELNNRYKALIIWDKGNHTLSNSDYMSKYEPIVYGWFDSHLFYGNRSNFDIWNIQRTQKNDLHPTMKPIALCAKAIENSSKKEDIILDFFGGSGSTLIASEQLNRKCYAMELDPKYCDVIIKRWEDFTGEKAVLLNADN